MDWTTLGSGWGTTYVRRTIHAYTERYANSTICGGITQLVNNSQEIIWLRGGGKYFLHASNSVSPQVHSTNFTVSGQTASVISTANNDVWSSATGSASFGGLKVSNNTVWHAGNDGNGSGLDADTVRGHAPVLIYNSAGTLLN